LDDVAAHAATELIALQGILHRGEEVARVQITVSKELKEVAVYRVRTGFSDDVDHRARANAILRREIVGRDVELLNRIRIRKWQVGVEIGIVVTGAIHLEVDRTGATTADVAIGLARVHTTLAIDQTIFAGLVYGTGRQIQQRRHVAAVQREFDDAL